MLQADPRPGHRVLDIGCGTGSLLILATQLFPDVEVNGVDPDAKALARAARKAQRAGVNIQPHLGFSDALAFPDASFDRVFSSFMFHHLRHARGWIAIAAIVAVIAAHVWLFTTLSRAHGWLALAAVIAGVVALKVAWWKFRR